MIFNEKYLKLLSRILFYVSIFVFSCLSAALANPGSQDEDRNSSQERYVFFLRHSPQTTCHVSLQQYDQREFEFKKEPDLGKGKIIRKMLTIGEYDRDHIPFAWNITQSRLYIDFNRNFDLTDDPNNVFEGVQEKRYQTFKDIPIRTTIRGEPYTYLVNINLYDTKRFRGVIESHSSWDGIVDLPQFKAEMSVRDNLDGKIICNDKNEPMKDYCLLLPLDFKDRPTSFTANSFNKLASFPVTEKIHINDRSYEVQYDFFKQGEGFDIRVIFEEKKPDMGSIRFLGENIKEVVLSGEYLFHLYSPSSEMKIPVGYYHTERILLQKPGWHVKMMARMKKRIKIESGKYSDFRAGGPLQNSLQISRFKRKYLSLYHKVTGIGNEEYTRENQYDPPLLEIFQGEEKILSDKFEFG